MVVKGSSRIVGGPVSALTRRLQVAIGRGVGRVTAGMRVLPDFLVIGVQRGGSSAFFAGLRSHPGVGAGSVKEVHYFDLNHGRGEGWYRSFFPYRASAPPMVGEATPNYIFHPNAPWWVAETLPDVQLIALLRDPVKRAHSAWKLMTRLGFESMGFEEALTAEEERIGSDLARLETEPDHPAHAAMRYSYISRGLYADQLERWFERFPRDRILVLWSEEFYADEPGTLSHASAFLGLPPHPFPATGAVNAAPTGSGGLSPGTAEMLRERFAEPNRRLGKLLGRPIPWS